MRARLVATAVLAVGTAGAVLAGACLPDLAAFPPAPDAGEASTSTQSLGCGDGVIETLDDGGDAGESCDPGEAGAAGCEACRFTCSGAIDDAGHCYFFADPTSTYNDAVTACRRADGHLVTFTSQREFSFASSLASDGGPFWLGLTVNNALGAYGPPPAVSEPGWPKSGNTCPGCFAIVASDAGTFAVHPDEDASTEHQCLVAADGAWLQVPCIGTEQRRTLCEREPIGQRIYPCGGLLCTTIPVTLGSKRYVIWPFAQTADEASSLCKTSSDGGYLVMFESNEEREQLVREIAQRLPTDSLELWMGLSSVNGAWTWDDDEPADGSRPLPWGNHQPAGGAGRAFLHIETLAVDTQLARTDPTPAPDETRYFVCQRPVE